MSEKYWDLELSYWLIFKERIGVNIKVLTYYSIFIMFKIRQQIQNVKTQAQTSIRVHEKTFYLVYLVSLTRLRTVKTQFPDYLSTSRKVLWTNTILDLQYLQRKKRENRSVNIRFFVHSLRTRLSLF